MSGWARRIRVVAAVFVGGGLVLVLHLYHLMIEQHPTWLERSYRNRWTFRDVPSQRGALLDREGRVIVRDEPAFSLALHYAAFRRSHPVGIAVHAANRIEEARGRGAPLGFHGAGPEQAFALLMATRLGWLRADGPAARVRKEVSEGAAALLAKLVPVPRSRARRALRDAADDATIAEVAATLAATAATAAGEDGAEAVARAYAVELAALRQLDLVLVPPPVPHDDTSDTNHTPEPPPTLLEVLEERRTKAVKYEADEAKEEAAGAGGANRDERRVRPEDLLVPIVKRLPFEQAAALQVERERWPGLRLSPGVDRRRRSLPGRDDLGTLEALLGIVSSVRQGADGSLEERAQQEVDALVMAADVDDSLPEEAPDELAGRFEGRLRAVLEQHYRRRGRIGRTGIEAVADERLSGRPGMRWVETDRRAVEQRLWSSLSVTPGEDVRLTIDLQLQEYAERALDAFPEAEQRALAVLDARTGGVLAIAARPVKGKWIVDERGDPRVWYAPPIGASYGDGSVGSVAKPFVVLEQLAAEREGRTELPIASFCDCAGRYHRVAGRSRPLACLGVHGAQSRDPVQALAHSCNTFFFQAAEGLGIDGLERAFARAGWLREPPLPSKAKDGTRPPALPEVWPGTWQQHFAAVPGWIPPALKPGDELSQNVAIGYRMSASVLSVARAYGGLATGWLSELHFVLGQRAHVPLPAAPADLEVVRDGLRACVVSGTARHLPGLRRLGVLGKTGTAEVGRHDDAVHNNAWFAGWVSRDDPRLAFAAVAYRVPHGTHGADAATIVDVLLQHIAGDPELRARWLPEAAESR